MPEAANDRGFAMTSSFSSMLLAGALVFGVIATGRRARLARRRGVLPMARAHPLAERLAAQASSASSISAATSCAASRSEAALKLLELTDGRVGRRRPIRRSGFRHGPKTIINGRTLVVVLLSNDSYARAYEPRPAAELRARGLRGRGCWRSVRARDGSAAIETRHHRRHGATPATSKSALLVSCLRRAIALRQSLTLGLTPDRPECGRRRQPRRAGRDDPPWNGAGPVDVPGR